MKEIPIYDPRRTPANWTELLAPSQYAVFQYDTRTGLHLSPAGALKETCLIFDTLDEAAAAFEVVNSDYERHCRAARDIAETFFDADRIVPQLLNDALGSRSTQVSSTPASGS